MRERKAKLKRAVKWNTVVRFSDDLTGTAQQVLDHACKLGLEGLIGKQADSVHVAGRTKSWLKLKCRLRQDFVIVRYTKPAARVTGLARWSSAFTRSREASCMPAKSAPASTTSFLTKLPRKFAKYKRPDSPLENPPREKDIQWLQAQLVARSSSPSAPMTA